MRNTFAAKLLVHRIQLISPILTSYHSKHFYSRHVLKMNEAFLRYEKGNNIFDISFRYVDEATKVDRQFNFSRRTAESVNNFLKRIDVSVCKIVNKKVREMNFLLFSSYFFSFFSFSCYLDKHQSITSMLTSRRPGWPFGIINFD